MLRLATANILNGTSLRDGLVDPDVLGDAARSLGVDVLGLQEVDRHQERSGRVDQTASVAAVLGAADWRFLPTIAGTPSLAPVSWTPVPDGAPLPEGPSYGVGLVSRLPVRSWHELRFPAARVGAPLLVAAQPRPRLMRVPDEPRAALAAVVETASGPVTVATAHLSFVPVVNARQLRTVVRWLEGLPSPRVLVGDLNLPGPLPGLVSGWPSLARVATYPAHRPRLQFDHALGSGVGREHVRSVEARELEVSDHCALVVELELP